MSTIYTTLGASNHTLKERQAEDYYATDPIAAEKLLEVEQFTHRIWEPAAGENHLANVFRAHGHEVRTSDLVKRTPTTEELDFLFPYPTEWDGDIVTNPPYKHALDFVKRALSVVGEGRKVAMFLKLTFLEGKERRVFFDTTPPHTVWVFSERIICAQNGDFEASKNKAIAFAWFVWEKGYKGDTIVRWIN